MSATIDPRTASHSQVSPARLRANRRNARRSTGPRTPEGKAASSRNAVTHGLCSPRAELLPGESHQQYWAFRHAMVDALDPRDLAQLTLAERAASCAWRLRRVEPAEAAVLASHLSRRRRDPMADPFGELLDPFGRPRPDLPGHRGPEAVAALQTLPPPPRSPGEALALVALDADADGPALERLGRYEQRLQNQLHRALRELRVLQERSTRDAGEQDEPRPRCPYVPASFYDGPEGAAEDAETSIAVDEPSIAQNEPNAAPSAASDGVAEGCDAPPQEPASGFSGTGVPPVRPELQTDAATAEDAEEEGPKT